jgi:uncharacterized membrane protein YgcG
MDSFFAQSYKLNNPTEKAAFFAATKQDPSQIWICKPVGANCGRGIFLVKDMVKFQEWLDELDTKAKRSGKRIEERLIQQYLRSPLLVKKRKFDLRSYCLIASAAPDVVFYREGYARLALTDYSLDNLDDRFAHLTNQAVQKKHEDYAAMLDDTTWSMSQLNDYVNQHYAPVRGLDPDWVLSELKKQIKQIMLYCYMAARPKLDRRPGFFDFLGYDFFVDENMHVWLIEINDNPALSTNTSHLGTDMPMIVQEALGLATEVFDHVRNKQPILPLESKGQYELLFMDSGKRAPADLSRSRPAASNFKSTAARRLSTSSLASAGGGDTATSSAPTSAQIPPSHTSLKPPTSRSSAHTPPLAVPRRASVRPADEGSTAPTSKAELLMQSSNRLSQAKKPIVVPPFPSPPPSPPKRARPKTAGSVDSRRQSVVVRTNSAAGSRPLQTEPGKGAMTTARVRPSSAQVGGRRAAAGGGGEGSDGGAAGASGGAGVGEEGVKGRAGAAGGGGAAATPTGRGGSATGSRPSSAQSAITIPRVNLFGLINDTFELRHQTNLSAGKSSRTQNATTRARIVACRDIRRDKMEGAFLEGATVATVPFMWDARSAALARGKHGTATRKAAVQSKQRQTAERVVVSVISSSNGGGGGGGGGRKGSGGSGGGGGRGGAGTKGTWSRRNPRNANLPTRGNSARARALAGELLKQKHGDWDTSGGLYRHSIPPSSTV